MAAPFSKTIPQFRVTYNNSAKTMTLLDLVQGGYSGYGTLSQFKGLFQAKDPDGNIFYQNAGYSITAPVFTYPDTDGNANLWTFTAFALPLDGNGNVKLGTYTFNYVCTINAGSTFVVVTKTYSYQYVSPTVVILQEVSCEQSTLTSTDDTADNYEIVINSVRFTPSTLTRSHTVTKPSDSGFTPIPGTTADRVRVIGGGSTDATELWTNDWQTDISTVLQYNLATWNDVAGAVVWIVVTDTATGHKGIDVQCADCDCTLLQCYLNLLDRYDEAEKGHRRGAFELREVVIKATAYMEAYSKELECGKDTTTTCQALQDILSNYDCSCGQPGSTSSRPIPKHRGSSIVSSAVTPFHFTFVDSPVSGNDGDLNLDSSNVLKQNIGGTWTQVHVFTTIKGDAGADGTNGTSASVLWNDVSSNATSAGTSEETLKSYTLVPGGMANNGDVLRVLAKYTDALNDNGKDHILYAGGDKLINYFSDSLIDATSADLILESEISRVSSTSQDITSKAIRNGIIDLVTSTATKALNNALVILANAQNSVASAADITCKQLEIIYNCVSTGTSVLVSNFKSGTANLVAGVPYDVTFLQAFTGGTPDVYTLNCFFVDQFGTGQVVSITPGSELRGGFQIVAPTDGVLNWTAVA
jgi:hypothetical protein